MGVSSWILFAFLSALTKFSRAELDPLALVVPWIGANALVVGLYIFFRKGWMAMKTRIWKVHLVRGIMVFFPFLLGVFVIRHLPLGQFMALVNLSPVILTALAAVWLNETVGQREVISLFFGFIGMLICIRPEFSYLSLLALAPLLNAVSIAFGNALICKYPEEPTLNWVFYQELIGFFAGLAFWFILDMEVSVLDQLKVIPLFVVIDITAMVLNYHAFRHIPASLLSPWFYIQIPAAALFGYFIFSEIPNWTTLIGATFIIFGGALNSWLPKKIV